jgi:7-cyano-7-deazaguanine synthase
METLFHCGHFKKSKKVEICSPSKEGLGKVDLVMMCHKYLGDSIFATWSCYHSNIMQCGKCESCKNRQKAFKEAGIKDRTMYQK